MSRIRETIDIRAPVDRIWEVVHVEISNVPRWSRNLKRCEVVGGRPLRKGSELRYEVRVPGGNTMDLHLEVQVVDRLQRCSGTMEGGPMRGTWSWNYRSRGDVTAVTYETEVKLAGLARIGSRFTDNQVTNQARRNLQDLKEYVEGSS